MKHNVHGPTATLELLATPERLPIRQANPSGTASREHEVISGPGHNQSFMRIIFETLALTFVLFRRLGASTKVMRANLLSCRGPVFERGALLLASALLASLPAGAQIGSPAPRPEEQPSLMKVLAEDGLHDIENESWNAYGQFTYISSWKPSFPALYTNLNGSINSLLPTAERSFTGTATLYLGVRLWRGAEAYFAPELISERPLTQLRGLSGEGIQNFEL